MGFRNISLLAPYWVLSYLFRHPPFYDMKPLGIYQKILKGIIEFPAFLSLRSKDLIRKLLNPEVKYRLGVADVLNSLVRMGFLSKITNGFEVSIGTQFSSVGFLLLGCHICGARWMFVGSIKYLRLLVIKTIQFLSNSKSYLLIFDLSYCLVDFKVIDWVY